MGVDASAGVSNTDTSNENQTQAIGTSSTTNLVNSVTNGASTTQGASTGVTNSANTTSATGTTNTKSGQTTSTTQAGQQATGQSSTQQNTSTTSSSQAAIDAINSNMKTATANSTDTSKTDALVSQILQQSALTFAPTQTAQTGAGLYNSSTLGMLSDYARAQATAQASEAVLNYQTGQQQLAATDAGNLANATKTTTGSTTDVLNSIMNSSSSGNSVISSLVSAITGGTTQNNGSTNSSSATSQQVNSSQNTAGAQSGKTDTANFGSGQSNGGSTTESGKAGFSLGDSVACSALHSAERFDHKLYLKSSARFNRLSPIVQDAYYCWGKPAARLISRKPDSLVARSVRWLLEHRAKRERIATALVFLLTLVASIRLLWVKDIRANG